MKENKRNFKRKLFKAYQFILIAFVVASIATSSLSFLIVKYNVLLAQKVHYVAFDITIFGIIWYILTSRLYIKYTLKGVFSSGKED